MRKLLLVILTVCALVSPHAARAQFFIPGTDTPLAGPGAVVFDPSNLEQLLMSVGIEGKQLDELITTYEEIVQVYNMTTNVWNSVAELTGADKLAPSLSNAAIRNPLPFTADEHPGWVGGFNDPSGLPFGTQYMGQNTVGGDPTVYADDTFAGHEILKAIRSLSSMQAVSTNHLSAIETRINGLTELFNQLANIGTVQESDSLSARLHNELNFANSQQVQAQQTMAAAQLQMSVLDNNARQWMYQDEANGIGAACNNVANAGGFVTFTACH